MALLSTCWLMIELVVIQDGFLKWFYMKLYMHPLILFLCQLFLWLYLFFLWLLPSFRKCHNAFSSLVFTFSNLFRRFLRFIVLRRDVTCDIKLKKETKKITNTFVNSELSERNVYKPSPAFSFSFKHQVDSQLKVLIAVQEGKILEVGDDDFFYEFEEEDVDHTTKKDVVELHDVKIEEEEDDIDIFDVVSIDKEDDYPLTNGDDNEENEEEEEEDEEEELINSYVEEDQSFQLDSDTDQSSPSSIASLNSEVQDPIVIENQTHRVPEDDETDHVFKIYRERMRWYDLLSRERTYGLNMIMNQETACSLSEWGKTTEKRLKESIEKDLELVYVAQSCLSWEALQHQYITVKDSSKPADSKGGFYNNDISREFQNFQVLLERFLEDEKYGDKRILSFVHRRLELIGFFQVPKLSGYKEEGPRKGEKEGKDKQLLKAIERCIEVFYDFVKVDIKKPLGWKKLKVSLVNSPLMEVEDPKDYKFFLDLKSSLHKKEQLLKEMQGNKKKKKWFKKKSSNIEEDGIGKDEKLMLVRFIMIDLKLVSRVLHMPLVSSSHLKWCQQKLNNIHFNGDKISRTSSPVLFPS